MTNDVATLYFVLSKVQMPLLDENIFRFVFSIGDSIITLRTPRLKNGAFAMPYKTSKQIFIKSNSNPVYRSFKIQIFIIDQINDTTISGIIKLKPEDYLNKSTINLQPYEITIENIDVTVTFDLSLIKGNSPPPSNFKDFPSTIKEISVEQRKRKNPVNDTQAEQPNAIINDEELELLEDDFEEEEIKEKKQQIQEPDSNDNARRHKHHRSERSEHQHESNSNNDKPSDSQKRESDGERRHRRKRTNQDESNHTPEPENSHSHRRKAETSQKEENEEGERRHRRKRTPEKTDDSQQTNTKSDEESGKKHRRKRTQRDQNIT